ncbi:mitochondrial-processing peptidase subunit alpha [Candidozyma auris]|nr:mitochondrial-processing peptidase subunit alpha [[Candida] auris]
MLSRSARLYSRKLSTSASPIQITKLANGLRVVTDSTPGHFSALGAYIDAGSRYENEHTSGHSHIMDRLAFKSTSKRSGKQMMDELARLGGNYMCGAQRESIMYQASVFNKDVNKMFDCIAETIREPQLTAPEIAEAGDTVEYELGELIHKHDLFLPEILHAAAYPGNTLGMPLHGSPDSLRSLTPEGIASFHKISTHQKIQLWRWWE